MAKKKPFATRTEQEAGEGLQQVKTEVPEARFQPEQQVNPAAAALSTNPEKGKFSKEKISTKGGVLKQEVAAHVVTQGIGGDVPESSSSAKTLAYSGNEGTILDSAAYTPTVGRSRSDSRFGKKQDAVAKKLNFVPSEQVELEVSESKPLAKNPDAVQGYNGSPRNTNAKMQKNVGGVPGELLFQRSIDEIKRHQLYFSTGQVVDYGPSRLDTPTKTIKAGATDINQFDTYSIKRGNFLHRNMRIKFKDGKLVSMKFDTVDLTSTASDAHVANASSAHATIDMNCAEIDRQRIDDKAGDEKAEIWSPLARAVREPTQTVGYLRDLENITGSEVFLAYKKTAECFSYQLNRAAKDGMKVVAPRNEALMGLLYAEDTSEGVGSWDPFATASYKAGASSLLIAVYDSTPKYKTKADVLLQPRGFKMAMQTADNNMNPLRVKADLVQNINAHEVFSTIDREYDPLMPVCISDRAGLIHCYDFNDLYAFTTDEHGVKTFTKAPFLYGYSDLRNNYVVRAALPLLAGLHAYLDSIAASVCSINSGALNNQEIVVPMVHSTCYFSLWSLLLLHATPFIAQERVNAMRDVLYYEKNVEYPFHQLIAMKDANPMNAVNYENSDYQEPLKVRRMQPALALTWVLPEVFWPFDEKSEDNAYSYVLPWYFNEGSFDFTTETLSHKNSRYTMSYPSTRAGSRFGFLDDIYEMEERDVRLVFDILTDIPTIVTGAGNQGVYKYSQNADGIPFATFDENAFTVKNFLTLPREQGDFIVAPAGVLEPMLTKPMGYKSMVLTDGTGSDDAFFAETSYVAKYWHGRASTAPGLSILNPININVDRATAYKQDWEAIPATMVRPASKDYGFTLTLSELFGKRDLDENTVTPLPGKGAFIPFTDGVNTSGGAQTKYKDADVYEVVSLQKALWTRVQMLPFAISPWDVVANSHHLGDEDGIKFDPFDFLYYFGFCGFKASDYTEDIYNRSTEVLEQGLLFIEDPFIKANPLNKEAIASTQSQNIESLR